MASERRWPNPADAPAAADLARCVHCGLCLNACPTFLITGLEAESPRGRIALARAVDEDRIPLTAAVQSHWELCLQCRACETACPSGVPFGRIMEHARAQLVTAPPAGGRTRWLRRQLIRRVVARPAMLSVAAAPPRWLANRGLVRRLMRGGRRLPAVGQLFALEGQLPQRAGRPFRAGDALAQPLDANASDRVLLLTGCIMGEIFGDVHRATGRVLARAGVAATAPAGQGCCGALSAHDGDLAFARQLAKRNIAAFEAAGDATIVVNSAGCGAAMKEYGELLSGEVAWRDRAARFAGRVRDLSEVLAGRPPVPGAFGGRVTYQDACHLAHAQGIREEPRRLLRGLVGCDLVETPGADTCCGAAGIYSLVQPEMSAQLRARKAGAFRAAMPDVVVTANPGCQLQYGAAVLEAGLKRTRVLHLAELLDEAQSAMESDATAAVDADA